MLINERQAHTMTTVFTAYLQGDINLMITAMTQHHEDIKALAVMAENLYHTIPGLPGAENDESTPDSTEPWALRVFDTHYQSYVPTCNCKHCITPIIAEMEKQNGSI